jgi:hypothetical protein
VEEEGKWSTKKRMLNSITARLTVLSNHIRTSSSTTFVSSPRRPRFRMSSSASVVTSKVRLPQHPPDEDEIMCMTASDVNVQIDTIKLQQRNEIGNAAVELYDRQWEGTAATGPFTFVCTQYNILAEVLFMILPFVPEYSPALYCTHPHHHHQSTQGLSSGPGDIPPFIDPNNKAPSWGGFEVRPVVLACCV